MFIFPSMMTVPVGSGSEVPDGAGDTLAVPVWAGVGVLPHAGNVIRNRRVRMTHMPFLYKKFASKTRFKIVQYSNYRVESIILQGCDLVG